MKKLIFTAAIALSSLATFATTTTSSIANNGIEVSIQEEYTEIKLEELPAAVTEALKKSYPDATLTKAYIDANKEYRLDVKVGEKEGSLFADSTGKFIQK